MVTGFSLFTANSLPLVHLSLSVIVLSPFLSHRPSVCLFQFPSGSPAAPSLHQLSDRQSLINSICTHQTNQMILLFCCSLPAHPPLPFHLSLLCIQCFPHARPVLHATPTLSRTPTCCPHTHTQTHTSALTPVDHSAVHRTLALVFVWPRTSRFTTTPCHRLPHMFKSLTENAS